mmetsp:Transcript_31508/g.61889  ORF Transcript_31508/g.61889 Transcript_31508/m.61889 type:complete len:97 (+) Transcript_31508:102-392(+)
MQSNSLWAGKQVASTNGAPGHFQEPFKHTGFVETVSTAEAAPLRLNGSSGKVTVVFLFTATEADDALIAIDGWHTLDSAQKFRQQHRRKPHERRES